MSRRSLLIVVLLAVVGGVLLFNSLPTDIPDPGREPGSAQIVAAGIPLAAGEESAIRIGFDAADPSARVLVTLEGTAGRGAVAVCPLAAPDDDLPDPERCVLAAGGVRESVTSPSGDLGGLAVVLRAGGTTTAEIRVEYAQGGAGISLRLPFIDARDSLEGCEDNACNPFLEVLPVRNGTLSATASFEGGPMTLEVLQGSVRARSQSATGIPYRIAARDTGDGPLRVEATLTAPGEYALALRQAVARAGARDVLIEATWPEV